MSYKVDDFKLGIDELDITYYRKEWEESESEIIDAQIFYDYIEQKVSFPVQNSDDPADISIANPKENLVLFNSLPILEKIEIMEKFLNTIRK